jgi:quinol monooxygenase YgiN
MACPAGPVLLSPPLTPIDFPMIIIQVYIHVLPESVDAFRAATLDNARNSVQEPGVVRFDVLQQEDDPTRFQLIEIYRTPEAPVAHKATAHYARWRDTVESMMAEPRRSAKFQAQFAEPAQWEMPA